MPIFPGSAHAVVMQQSKRQTKLQRTVQTHCLINQVAPKYSDKILPLDIPQDLFSLRTINKGIFPEFLVNGITK